jgi:hypothetical protein
MNRQPDKIFREKLQGYQKPAPADAWARVSENLQRKSRPFPWLKMAAAVVLIAVATFFLFPFKHEDQQIRIAEHAKPAAKDKSETAEVNERTESLSPENNRKRSDAAPVQPARKSLRKSSTPLVHSEEQTPVVIDTAPEAIDDVTISSEPSIADAHATPEELQTSGERDDVSREEPVRRVTIVFTANEVNEKYLEKKEMAEATPNDQESSSLRKLLDKAYDLKHNQDPLGELRQKKNEILAFNFKTDKQQHD